MPGFKRSVIYCVSFIIAFLCNIAFDLACGPEPDPYDYYVSFFNNSIQKNNDQWSFYFNGWLFLNDDQNGTNERDINVCEWRNYLGKRVRASDIDKVLYDFGSHTDSVYLRNINKLPVRPDSIKNNTFLTALYSAKFRNNAPAYLALVKRAEPFLAITYDDKWNPLPRNKKQIANLAKLALQNGLNETDRFIKLRYFYLAQRLLHYSDSKEASTVYDKYIANYPSKSHVKSWALSFKAGEELALGHKARAGYLFSKVFTTCPELRVQAYNDIKTTGAPYNEIVRQTVVNSEKATIFAIEGFREPRVNINALQKLYHTYPKSDLVSVLLVREINKIEEGYLTPKLNGSKYYGSIGVWNHKANDSTRNSYVKYIPALKTFCEKLSAEKKYPEPALGTLAAAYLSWIQGKPQEGLILLNSIKNSTLSRRLKDQRQLINLLLLSKSIKKIDTAAEALLLPSLNWLNNKVQWEKANLKADTDKYSYTLKYKGQYHLRYYNASQRDYYKRILAPIYLKQGDTVKAALCILRSELTTDSPYYGYQYGTLGYAMPFYWQTELHSYHLNTILNWRNSPNASPYMGLLLTDVRKAKQINIYDLLGTAYLREHRYQSAANAYKHITKKQAEKADDDVYEGYFRNPFANTLHDYPRPFTQHAGEGYSRLRYALAMAKLQNRVKTDADDAAAWYKMANGLYNTSFYGNAWSFTAYNKAADDIDLPVNSFYYNKDYLYCKTAEVYYLKAAALSKDKEFKARCIFMAAKCRQKQITRPVWPDWTDYDKAYKVAQASYDKQVARYEKNIRQNFYFKQLQQQYPRTKFYKTAVNECSYFRDFLNAR